MTFHDDDSLISLGCIDDDVKRPSTAYIKRHTYYVYIKRPIKRDLLTLYNSRSASGVFDVYTKRHSNAYIKSDAYYKYTKRPIKRDLWKETY